MLFAIFVEIDDFAFSVLNEIFRSTRARQTTHTIISTIPTNKIGIDLISINKI